MYVPQPSYSQGLVPEDNGGGREELDTSVDPEPSFSAITDGGEPVIVSVVTDTPTVTPPTIIITEEGDSAPSPGIIQITAGSRGTTADRGRILA